MGEKNSRTDPQELVELVIPVQHVKTVKTALEQSGQLDRSSKITAETHEFGHTEGGGPDLSKSNAMGPSSSHGQASGSESSTGVPFESIGTTQFPALQFNPVSGEYRDPVNLQPSTGLQFDVVTGQYKKPADQPQLPILEFHPESGEYSKPADSTKFPRLDFDPVTGEYRDSSEIQQYPALEFDVGCGQYEERSGHSQLHFDPASGEYRPVSTHHGPDGRTGVQGQRMRIPTTIPYEFNKDNEHESEHESELKTRILEGLGLGELSQVVSLSHSTLTNNIVPTPARNHLQRALQAALEENYRTLLAPLGLTVESLLSHFPDSYSIYTPMLLLPNNAFASPSWQKLLSTHPPDSDALKPLWSRITHTIHATHIALNSPIPPQTPSTDQPNDQPHSNILRSPLKITPFFGSFGPQPTPLSLSSPTPADFATAFWVRTTQNGIHQTWAPLYTMFSRGNIKEKARILHFPSLTTTNDDNNNNNHNDDILTAPTPAIAADLYAGIGYFAFSYRKSNFRPTLAWELNPWSIEGLRRAAALNHWTVRIITPASLPTFQQESTAIQEDFLVFHMSNESAAAIVVGLREGARLVGRVRHVNLGLLPHSRLAWGEAARVLDPSRGGWIHAHENVAVGDIEERSGEVEREFERLVGEVGVDRKVEVEHAERVKMYAPGVAHCVFDVHVFPDGARV